MQAREDGKEHEEEEKGFPCIGQQWKCCKIDLYSIFTLSMECKYSCMYQCHNNNHECSRRRLTEQHRLNLIGTPAYSAAP
eukprot:COSAG03_NODE_148_length_11571_cov_9.471583_11_plen_80_part_00